MNLILTLSDVRKHASRDSSLLLSITILNTSTMTEAHASRIIPHRKNYPTLERRGKSLGEGAFESDLRGWVELELAKVEQGHSTQRQLPR